jgi:hypothetical protein
MTAIICNDQTLHRRGAGRWSTVVELNPLRHCLDSVRVRLLGAQQELRPRVVVLTRAGCWRGSRCAATAPGCPTGAQRASGGRRAHGGTGHHRCGQDDCFARPCRAGRRGGAPASAQTAPSRGQATGLHKARVKPHHRVVSRDHHRQALQASDTSSIDGGPPPSAEPHPVGNFDERQWGISVVPRWAPPPPPDCIVGPAVVKGCQLRGPERPTRERPAEAGLSRVSPPRTGT